MCSSKNINRHRKSTQPLIDTYNANKEAKTGTSIKCACCPKTFIKKQYSQAFCCGKCKDAFWNKVDKKKFNNVTRISPANARYKANVILPQIAFDRGFPTVSDMLNHVDDFDGGWDAHNCYVEPCSCCGMRSEFCQCPDFD